jgi:hypothetical protein
MKRSYLIIFFGLPLLLFGVLFVARYAYGADIPPAFLVVLSLFPIGFVVWFILRGIASMVRTAWGGETRGDAFGITYQGGDRSWLYYLGIVILVPVLAVIVYFLFILLGDLLRTLPALEIFL